ncbi:sec-independent protein translocase protein TatA [Dyella jiangningensis]|uniref:twin-arginine translocase TatA/TatE family subunit n=1 Tax=Dyella sp. AtDHG13 TaxID=1938897 RepID=UPI000891DE1A|nr:sec-independent protein translocase protein TatA [Dyella sp. AtDHG13]SDL33984.1 sec-independent protein translocase protein TatA [Dyella jiangningensis]
MGSFSAFHWVVVLAVVVLVFGTGKLRSIGSDLGAAVKEFKKNIDDEKPTLAITDPLERKPVSPMDTSAAKSKQEA